MTIQERRKSALPSSLHIAILLQMEVNPVRQSEALNPSSCNNCQKLDRLMEPLAMSDRASHASRAEQ